MNWFVNRHVGDLDLESKKEILKRRDICNVCEHVESDASLLAHVTYECDSFGREGSADCQVCHDEYQRAQDEEEVVCNDCGQVFQRKDTISWKWYDFYAAQGDEPVIVCKTCQTRKLHLSRLQRDRENYEAETGLDY